MNLMAFTLLVVFVKKRERPELLDRSLVICDVWTEGRSHTDPAREPLMLRTAVHTLDSVPPGTWETRSHVDWMVSCWSHTPASPSQLFSIGAHIVK